MGRTEVNVNESKKENGNENVQTPQSVKDSVQTSPVRADFPDPDVESETKNNRKRSLEQSVSLDPDFKEHSSPPTKRQRTEEPVQTVNLISSSNSTSETPERELEEK